jgi:hypothetical protein
MSRLGLGLGLTKGGVIPFNPLSLDPYLLFDTQSSMIGTFENPTLDLDPSDPDTLDVITATRAGVATYTDASGNIQTASPNTVRVDHVQGEELTPAVYQHVSNTDFSDWIQASYTTLTNGSGYAGQPSKIFEATSGTHRLFRSTTFGSTAGTTYVGSIWIRRVSGSGAIYINHQDSAQGNLTTITDDISEEWTRVEVDFTGHASSGDMWFGIWVAVQGDSVEIAMPQVEEGTTASSFVANTTGSPKLIAAATYADRVPMILVEPSATNLARYTDFSDVWTTLGAAPVTSETGDGLAGQPSVILTATANSGRFRQGLSGDVAGVTYTASIWIRRISGSGSIRFEHNSSPTGGASSPLNVTEEWSRVEAQFEGDCFAWGIQIDTSGDSVEIAMPQVEEGTVATSFIPTSGSTVTRAADDLVIDGSDFSDFYNASEGTFYLEFTPNDLTNAQTLHLLRGGVDNRRFFYSDSGVSSLRSYDGANVLTLASNSVESNALHRVALSFDSTTMKGSLDGATEVASNHNGNLLTSTELEVGPNYIGHIKRLIYWPYHSDNL